MSKNSLCAMVLTVSGCFPSKSETPPFIPVIDIPVINIPLNQEAVNYKSIVEKDTPKQLSKEILKNLEFTLESSRKFFAEPFEIVVYYGRSDIGNTEALQYFIVNQSSDNMIIFEDVEPYGSLDKWDRCPLRGGFPIRNIFKCYTMDSKDKYVNKLFEETIRIVHLLSQNKSATATLSSLNEKYYKKKYVEILLGNHGQELDSGTHAIPW